MKRCQFVSPIVIFMLIVISFLIIYYESNFIQYYNDYNRDFSMLFSDVKKMEDMDINYQLNLTNRTIMLLNSINSSGTIRHMLEPDNINISFGDEVWLNYSKRFCDGGVCMTINNTIVIPYPYAEFLMAEENFDKEAVKKCIDGNCLNADTCVNNLDSGTLNYSLVSCIMYPLRIKLDISDSRYILSLLFPYHMFNNTYLSLD